MLKAKTSASLAPKPAAIVRETAVHIGGTFFRLPRVTLSRSKPDIATKSGVSA